MDIENNFYVYGKTVFISYNIINYVPNVVKKIKSIFALNCGDDDDLIFDTNNVLALYIDTTKIRNEYALDYYGPIVNINNLENIYYEMIEGFLIFDYFNFHTEISVICVQYLSNPIEVTKGIISNTITAYINDLSSIFMTVSINNIYWDALVDIAISIGFDNPVITDTTPSGKKFEDMAISLVYHKEYNDADDIDIKKYKIKEIADSLKQATLAKYNICNIDIYIPVDVMKDIYIKYINNKVEYGGSFALYKEKNGVYELNVPENSISKGSEDTYAVMPPENYLNWHTHPSVCYTDFKCYIGWPSGQDMSYVFENFINFGLLTHFVITVEGVYIVKITTMIMKYLSELRESECIIEISNIIRERFTNLEEYRLSKNILGKEQCEGLDCLKVDKDQREIIMKSYLSMVSITTINDLISWAKNYQLENSEYFYNIDKLCLNDNIASVPIFSVNFYDWDIVNNNGIHHNIVYTPPSVDYDCSVLIK